MKGLGWEKTVRIAILRFAVAFAVLISSAGPSVSEGFRFVINDPAIRLDFIPQDLAKSVASASDCQLGGAGVEPHLRLGVNSDTGRRATYASAGFATSFAEIDIGRPRSILDTGPIPKGAPGVPKTIRPLADEAALNDLLGAGLRVAGRQGNVSFGSSIHTLEDSSLTLFGVAGRYDLAAIGVVDNVAVYGGAESGGDDQRFRLGTEVTQGIATAGVNLLKSNEDEGRTLSQIYLGLAVTPNVSLGLSGLRDTLEATSQTDTRFGLGASLAMEGGAYFRGGVDGITSEDPAFGLSVGFEF